MLLGTSVRLNTLRNHSPKEAWMVRVALHLFMLMPLMMIFSRTMLEICALLIIALFFLRSFMTASWGWLRSPPIFAALMLWFYSTIVVTPMAQNVDLSLARVDWIRFVFLFAAIVYWLSDYEEEMRRIGVLILLLIAFVALDAVFQFYTGASLRGTPYQSFRLTGTFTKPIVGIFCVKMAMPIIGYLIYEAMRSGQKNMLYALISIALSLYIFVIMTNERYASVAATLSIFTILFFATIFYPKFRRYALILSAVIATLWTVAYFNQASLSRRVVETTAVLQEFGKSHYVFLFDAARNIFLNYPFTGVGMANYREACPLVVPLEQAALCAEHPHNIYLEVLGEMGAIGFLLFIGFVTCMFAALPAIVFSANRYRLLATFSAGSLLVTLFPFAITQSFFSNWPGYLAWTSMAWSISVVRMAGFRK